MSFDPEKVDRFFDARDSNGDLYLASSNWPMPDKDQRGIDWVQASDYDQLLQLYRELQARTEKPEKGYRVRWCAS